MKKLVKILGCVAVAFIFLFASVPVVNKTKAVGKTQAEFSNDVLAIIEEYSLFVNRVGGSKGEKEAAEFIKEYLDKTDLSAKDNAYVHDGVQTFDYESSFTNKFETSQNIVYIADMNKKSDKKVILGCHYDAYAYDFDNEEQTYKESDSASVNGSAASVGFLLALASNISTWDIDFDVEFVFFGAGAVDKAGSRIYTNGISEEDKKDILCMMNFDEIALGQNVYFYIDELANDFSKYANEVSHKVKSKVREVGTVHLNKTILPESNELGLNYTHIALESDHINFMKENILTINFFAGDYETGIVLGKSEFGSNDVLTYTKKDNLEYIKKHIGIEKVTRNIGDIYGLVSAILTDADFVETAIQAKDKTSIVYTVFANRNLIVYLTALEFIVFVIIAMYMYYKLSIKAYKANVEAEFLSTVIKVSESIDEEGKDMNVPKAVSQVIARDIKKDKAIKPSKKNKKKD